MKKVWEAIIESLENDLWMIETFEQMCEEDVEASMGAYLEAEWLLEDVRVLATA